MKPINADLIKERYPERLSLNQVMNKAEILTASSIIEWVREEMCNHYCKMPYGYSVGEWEGLLEDIDNPDCPCNKCPLQYL